MKCSRQRTWEQRITCPGQHTGTPAWYSLTSNLHALHHASSAHAPGMHSHPLPPLYHMRECTFALLVSVPHVLSHALNPQTHPVDLRCIQPSTAVPVPYSCRSRTDSMPLHVTWPVAHGPALPLPTTAPPPDCPRAISCPSMPSSAVQPAPLACGWMSRNPTACFLLCRWDATYCAVAMAARGAPVCRTASPLHSATNTHPVTSWQALRPRLCRVDCCSSGQR